MLAGDVIRRGTTLRHWECVYYMIVKKVLRKRNRKLTLVYAWALEYSKARSKKRKKAKNEQRSK